MSWYVVYTKSRYEKAVADKLNLLGIEVYCPLLKRKKLWIYNVKNRRLGVYVANDEAGLAVKGSTIENYKYSESISKTLRKPKDVLSRVLDGGKVVLRKVMGEINSKPSELNGRINKDTILLRVE